MKIPIKKKPVEQRKHKDTIYGDVFSVLKGIGHRVEVENKDGLDKVLKNTELTEKINSVLDFLTIKQIEIVKNLKSEGADSAVCDRVINDFLAKNGHFKAGKEGFILAKKLKFDYQLKEQYYD